MMVFQFCKRKLVRVSKMHNLTILQKKIQNTLARWSLTQRVPAVGTDSQANVKMINMIFIYYIQQQFKISALMLQSISIP